MSRVSCVVRSGNKMYTVYGRMEKIALDNRHDTTVFTRLLQVSLVWNHIIIPGH